LTRLPTPDRSHNRPQGQGQKQAPTSQRIAQIASNFCPVLSLEQDFAANAPIY
jgi:hypothetical protein